jgi:hypothetical protein
LRRQIRLSWVLALVFVGLALAFAPFVGEPGKGLLPFLVMMGAIAGLGGGLTAGVVALVLRSTARRVDQQLASFRRGQYLAHWTYRPDEWRSFAETEWASARWGAWVPVFVFLVVLGIILSFVHWTDMKEDDVVVLTIFCPLFVGFALFGFWLVRSFGRANYQRALRRVGETYIGPRGIYFNGWYHTWDSFGIGLQDIRVIEGKPTVVEVSIGPTAALQASAFAVRGGTRSGYTLRVLVPAGREEEAKGLVQRISVALG